MTVERPLLFAECFRPGNRPVGKWVAEYGTPLQRGGRVIKSKTPVRLWEPLGEGREAREGENSIGTPRRKEKRN